MPEHNAWRGRDRSTFKKWPSFCDKQNGQTALAQKKSINSSAPAARARPYEGLKEFTIFIEKDFVPHFVQVFHGLRTDLEWNISKMGRVILKCEEWKCVPPPAAICDPFFSKQGNSEKKCI